MHNQSARQKPCGAVSQGSRRTMWKKEWGAVYTPGFKRRELVPIIDSVEKEGRLGKKLIDVGSGSLRETKSGTAYYPTDGKRVVRIDIGAPEPVRLFGNIMELQADIEKLGRGIEEREGVLAAMAAHLGADTRSGLPRADTLLLLDILNYVDYRETIRGLMAFLEPGGRIVISNIPGMGFPEAISDKGVKGNKELVGLLADCGLEMEHLHHPPAIDPQISGVPWSPPRYPSKMDLQDGDGIVLVAVNRHAGGFPSRD